MATIFVKELSSGDAGGMGRVKFYSKDTVVLDIPFYGKIKSGYTRKLMPDPPPFDRVEFEADEGVIFEGHVEG